MAGLTAAAFLREHDVPFVVYEAAPRIAGLAASHCDAEGYSYDFGAHFITNRLAAAIGLASKCRNVRHYGESVLLDGRILTYPFGLMRVPRFLRNGISCALRRRPSAESAAEQFRTAYGRALADEVAIPLLEAWSGVPASDLAPSVAERFRNSISQIAVLKVASWVTGRAVACGYSHEAPENPHVWHVYPEGGVSSLCQHLAAGVSDAIRLESPVEAILVEGGEVKAVRVAGRDQPVSAVVSTAPCNVLPRLVRGSDALHGLSRFRYRAMIFVNLRLDGRGLIPNTVLWTPESQYPFFRLTETPLSMPWLAPSGKTLITVDIGSQVGDKFWVMDDAAITELCLEHLQSIIPGVRRRFRGCSVLRTPIAYPVFLREYEDDRRRLEQSTGIAGLYSVGRNGEFAHILMEDVYWRTQKKMRELVQHFG